MDQFIINIASDFSETPGPRNITEGDFSGELFRDTILNTIFEQALSQKKKIIVNLDGTFGYGTSFLEEAFGGLARKYSNVDVLNYIDFISIEEPYLIDDIKGYINDIGSDT